MTRRKATNNVRRILGVVSEALPHGLLLAPKAPLIVLLIAALSDYEFLRAFLLSASSKDMSWIILLSLLAGFVGGTLIHICSSTLASKHHSFEAELGQPGSPMASLFWRQPEGRELAIREATTSRLMPTAEIRWAIDDLIKELARLDNQPGSDLLDRRVIQLMGLDSKRLKPSQDVSDAKILLNTRYGGVESAYEWETKLEERDSSFTAYISVRAPSRAGGSVNPWLRCMTVNGPSAAIAITIAALTKETWSFTL